MQAIRDGLTEMFGNRVQVPRAALSARSHSTA
jgi:hypothetical protein